MSHNHAGAFLQKETQSLLYILARTFTYGLVHTSVVGPDISFYQDNNNTARKVDFARMRTSGAKFVICRAGQNNWPDPDFADYWRDAKAAGIPRGSYWFYDSRYPPEKQAELWVSILGADRGELPMWADLEESYGGAYSGPSNWRKFIERVKILAPGKEIGVYTAYGYWSANCPAADRPYFAQYPLWVANYGVVSPRLPPGWSDYLFWQFTSNGDGPFYGVESYSIDLNYYNGDLASFQQRFSGSITPPPPPPPPAEPKQKGVVVVGALNVRAGPGIEHVVINGMVRDDICYGNVDPSTGWIRISQIKRIATGLLDSLDGWANASSQYMRVSAIDALPPGGDMELKSITYANGVKVITNRLNDHSWYRAVIVPPGAISTAGFWRPNGCKLVEDVPGDFVFNFAPFNAPCVLNMGVRLNGIEYQIYDGLSQGSYAPFWWWDDSGKLFIDHRKTVWKTLPSAQQGWRYLVEAGIKNPRSNIEWDARHPRRCVGRLPDGSTVVLSIAGRDYLASLGATLHECAELLLQLGCDYAIDGDGGGSTSDVLRFADNSAEVFRGTAEVRTIPTGGVIKFKAPIDQMIEPPPPPPTPGGKPSRTRIEMDNGEIWEADNFHQVQ